MLELRPSCEHCDKDLPPNSSEAMICTFECTFCSDCVEQILENVCPNCGGGFCSRPIRPKNEHIVGLSLGQYPATATKTYKPVELKTHKAFSKKMKNIPPFER